MIQSLEIKCLMQYIGAETEEAAEAISSMISPLAAVGATIGNKVKAKHSEARSHFLMFERTICTKSKSEVS